MFSSPKNNKLKTIGQVNKKQHAELSFHVNQKFADYILNLVKYIWRCQDILFANLNHISFYQDGRNDNQRQYGLHTCPLPCPPVT